MGYLRKIAKWTLNIGLTAILIVSICLLSQVDNWKRDLFYNYAGTSVAVKKTPEEAEKLVLSSIKELEWELTEDSGIHAVRSTRLGFKDDVYVYIEDFAGELTLIRVWSKSRTGIADFGQNPRNILELLQTLDDKMGD